jgi:hypothetical protein
MSTFPRGHSSYSTFRSNHSRISRLSTGGHIDLAMIRQHTAADGTTLRGIPAIGRGVTGATPDTRPDRIAYAAA